MQGGYIVMIVAGGLLLVAWIVCAIGYALTKQDDWGGGALVAFFVCIGIAMIGGLSISDGKMKVEVKVFRGNVPILIEHNDILYRVKQFELPVDEE